MSHLRIISLLALVLALGLSVANVYAHPHQANKDLAPAEPVRRLASFDVDPPLLDEALQPGESVHVSKWVETPEIPPYPDIVILADSTGSMGDALANVQANAVSIMMDILDAEGTANFAAAEYRDAEHNPPDGFNVQINQNLTDDTTAVQIGINTWSTASGVGGDEPECQLGALGYLASNINWRSPSTRIIVWFGDSNGHDPCGGFTLVSAIAALQAENIQVIAISITTTGNGLDNGGQATDITDATNGVLLDNASPDQVSDLIIQGLDNLPITVVAVPTGCDPLDVELSPTQQTVISGQPIHFDEWITAPDSDFFCDDVNCSVLFETPAGDILGEQYISIEALDVIPPTAICPDDAVVECGEGVPDAFAAWNAEFSAEDNCPDVTFAVDCDETPGCGATTSIDCTNTATDTDGNVDDCASNFTTVDTTAPDIFCNAPATITPNEAPITFCANATDICCGDDVEVWISGFRCFAINGAGKEIDKGDSCIVSIAGPCITIVDGGGVGTYIEWTVDAVDCCDNAADQTCITQVVRKPKPPHPHTGQGSADGDMDMGAINP